MRWPGFPFLQSKEAKRESGTALRGKVSRNSVIKGGELSVVIRFGIEEADRVRDLLPGALVSVALEQKADKGSGQ